MPLEWKWRDWLCVKEGQQLCYCCQSVTKTQICNTASFSWVHVAQPPVYTLLKMTRAFLVQFMIYHCWGICKHIQTRQRLHIASLHTTKNKGIWWILHLLIRRNETLTNRSTAAQLHSCTADSVTENFVSQHPWQRHHYGPSNLQYHNPVPFYLAALSTNGREG